MVFTSRKLKDTPELALRMGILIDKGMLPTKMLVVQGYTLKKLKIYF